MIDYLVVGSGLAGMSFCNMLQRNNKSFLLYDDAIQQASTVAAGVYNPVVLKRFKIVWKAAAQLKVAIPFYEELQRDLAINIHYKIPVYRKLTAVEEQNLWFEATDKKEISPFLSTTLIKNKNPHINAPFSFGEVMHTGRVDLARLQNAFRKNLQANKLLVEEKFEYDVLKISSTAVAYKEITAKNIVFCEGFGMRNNPLFNYLPLQGAKGELLTIKAPLLQLKQIIKSSVFIIPSGNDTYKVGATYHWDDKTNTPTVAAKEELLTKLKTILNCPFKVINHEAGIRPTVIDRRPLAGTHPVFSNVHILNGMGSRGVLMAPFAARKLYDRIENQVPLDKEIDIVRFEKKYFPEEK